MAGTVSAGSIVYEVDMDTAKLLAARREVDEALRGLSGNMGRLDASITRTEQTVSSMGRSMSSLSGVAKGLMAALSVKQVSDWANEWVTVNNKLANSVKENESLADVTQRVFDISQNTMSSISATATLYGRLERATRSAGTSTQDLTTLTETINKGLSVSGATTEEASSTMIQLSQALASGVLRGEEFNSMSENGSRLAGALADSLGVTIGQLRGMAAQGKLTTDVVVNGLLSQSGQIAKEFSNTTATLSQSLEVAGNNLIKFFGENTTVRTFLSSAGSGVVTLSNNIDTLASALSVAAVVMGGRYFGALAMAATAQGSSVKATIQSIAATRQQAQQEAATAAVLVRKTQADAEAALSALNLARAEYNVAKGSAAEAFALENLIRLESAYIAVASEAALARNAQAAAQARVAATGITLANTMKVVNLVTAPLGGPVGVIATVAAGWYLYAQRQAEARKEAIAFSDTLPDVINRLKQLNLTQAEGVRADTVTSIKAQKQAIDDLKQSISSSQADYEKYTTLAQQYGVAEDENNGYVINAKEAANELAKKRRDLDGANARLQQSEDALHLINIQVNQGIVDQMKAARDNAAALSEAEKKASFLGATQAFLADKFGISTAAIQKFNAESLKINWGGKSGEKLIKQAERKLELSKLQGEAQARLQAQYDAEDSGVSDPLAVKKLQDVYAATVNVTQAKANQKKEDKSAAAESKRSAAQAESVAQKLDQLRQQSDLNAVSSQNLTLEQAKLRAEMSLGKNATTAQREEAAKYAEAIWQQAAALKARNLIPEVAENDDYRDKQAQLDLLKNQTDSHGKLLLSEQQYNEQSEKLAQQHLVNLQKIRAQEQTTNPIASARAEVDPIQQLTNQYNQQKVLSQQYQSEELAILQAANAKRLINDQQYQSAKATTENQYRMLRTAADNQYDQQRTAAEWQLLSQQGLGYQTLTSAVDAFSQSAGSALTSVITGASSGKEAMEQLGQAILSSVVNTLVQAAVQALIVKPLLEAFGVTAESSLGASTAAAGESYAAWAPAAVAASIATLGSAAGIGVAAYAGATLAGEAIGKRKNGGSVQGGSMYQVGESGLPEIYKASNGSQYMIPGDNGSVLSNKDITGGSSSGITVSHVVNNYASGVNVQNQTTQNGNQVIIETLLTDMESGGPVSSSMQSTFGLSRKATGDY